MDYLSNTIEDIDKRVSDIEKDRKKITDAKEETRKLFRKEWIGVLCGALSAAVAFFVPYLLY